MTVLWVRVLFFCALFLFSVLLVWNWLTNLERAIYLELTLHLEHLDNEIREMKASVGQTAEKISKLATGAEVGALTPNIREIKTAVNEIKKVILKLENTKRNVGVSQDRAAREIKAAINAMDDRISKLDASKRKLSIPELKISHQIKQAVSEIKHGISQLNFKTSRDNLWDSYNSSSSNIANRLPSWIEIFAAPHWSTFAPWRGVFVFFVTYRYEYLRTCLESIAAASADIDNTSVCVFVLDKATKKVGMVEKHKTTEVIKNVSFCKVVVWKADSEQGRPPEKNFALRLKRHWWFVLESVFNATITGNLFGGSLLGYTNDILFVEEDTVFAPDFIKVMWFASEVKRRNAHIIQFALGSWSGENMINAHPDTLVVRTARDLRGIAYGLNQSTWLHFKTLEKSYFDDGQHDWCESMGLVLGKNNGGKGFRIIVPTLSRIWHIGKQGLGPGGDYNFDREVTRQPNWAHASRLMDLRSARVSHGLRDLLGFLCKTRIEFWFLKDMECHLSMARWKGKDRNKIMCAKQPYVTDPCDANV